MDRAAQIPGRELRLPADMQEVEQVELAGGEGDDDRPDIEPPPGVMAEAAAAGMAVAAQSDTALSARKGTLRLAAARAISADSMSTAPASLS